MLDFVRQTQNPDGGWGYRTQGMSFVEPTAAALLALASNPSGLSTIQERARDFLLATQHRDGGWGIAPMDAESGWMTAWAVWALAMLGGADDAVARGVQWLVAVEPMRLTDDAGRAHTRQLLNIDSTLRGFPWQPGDAAWVQPTALALIALNAAGQGAHSRVRQGVAYLYDRAAPSGGWNVGNPWMIGKAMPVTVQDTALVLLTLRALDEAASEPPIANALIFLRDALTTLNTPSDLAWAMWALREWKLNVGSWMLEIESARARLNAMQQADGSWQGNPFITAIAMASQK